MVRIAICSACAEGRCSACIDVVALARARAAGEPTVAQERQCVCRHSEAPRAASRGRAEPPPSVPQSAPFELEAALADAREAGRGEGHAAGYLEAAEEAEVLRRQVAQLESALLEARSTLQSGSSPASISGPDGIPSEVLAQLVVLVELDPNGGLVGIVTLGSLERCADEAWQFEPALPGHYVEAWMAGSDDPVLLPGGGG